MAASRALRLGFALSLTGTGYVDLSLLHVPGNLRVTFVYARVCARGQIDRWMTVFVLKQGFK